MQILPSDTSHTMPRQYLNWPKSFILNLADSSAFVFCILPLEKHTWISNALLNMNLEGKHIRSCQFVIGFKHVSIKISESLLCCLSPDSLDIPTFTEGSTSMMWNCLFFSQKFSFMIRVFFSDKIWFNICFDIKNRSLAIPSAHTI